MENKEIDVTAEKQDNNTKSIKTKVVAVVILLLLLSTIATIYRNSMFSKDQGELEYTPKPGVQGQVSEQTLEEMQKQVDEAVRAGMQNIVVNTEISLHDSKSPANVMIQNTITNKNNIQVKITEADSGELIYNSKIIKPGYKIEEAKLDNELEQGKYDVLITTYSLDGNNKGYKISSVKGKITVLN